MSLISFSSHRAYLSIFSLIICLPESENPENHCIQPAHPDTSHQNFPYTRDLQYRPTVPKTEAACKSFLPDHFQRCGSCCGYSRCPSRSDNRISHSPASSSALRGASVPVHRPDGACSLYHNAANCRSLHGWSPQSLCRRGPASHVC